MWWNKNKNYRWECFERNLLRFSSAFVGYHKAIQFFFLSFMLHELRHGALAGRTLLIIVVSIPFMLRWRIAAGLCLVVKGCVIASVSTVRD